jgi:bifunctional DNA-binding transcriptional regulator/antitoxin component of YhaV-PrlF toxin-antitoxin module
MSKSTITSKGQTTVPREIRRRLAVGEGDVLAWELVGTAVRVEAAHRAFLQRRGTIQVGRGSSVADVREARRRRGADRT